MVPCAGGPLDAGGAERSGGRPQLRPVRRERLAKRTIDCSLRSRPERCRQPSARSRETVDEKIEEVAGVANRGSCIRLRETVRSISIILSAYYSRIDRNGWHQTNRSGRATSGACRKRHARRNARTLDEIAGSSGKECHVGRRRADSVKGVATMLREHVDKCAASSNDESAR